VKLAELAIRRRITFTMVYLLIIGAGLFGLLMLKLDFYPNLQFPMIMVITRYTGVGANDIENIISRPLEKILASVKNIKKLTSRSSSGISLVTMEFNWGDDLDQAEINVRKNIDFALNALPDDADKPLVFAFETSSIPVVLLSVGSDTKGPAQLKKFLDDDIEPYLERIDGVASAETMGGLARSVQIRVNPLKLAQYHLDINDLAMAIRRENLRLPTGSIDDGVIHYDLQAQGEFASVKEIARTAVANVAGKTIYLKDVAQVEDSYDDVLGNTRVNYRSGLVINISKQSDANTVEVCKRIMAALEKLNSTYQSEAQFSVFFNQSEYITNSINNLKNTALQAIVYTFLVLLFFLLHLRSSSIVAVTIPISLVATFFVMYLANVTLNIISLTGLALGIGMLVDNSIVVLENIFRHRKLGEPLKRAAYNGASEVGMAVTASTLTTLAVFIPLLFVPGIAGVMFRDMILTVCFSLTVSLLASLSLIPMLSSVYLENVTEEPGGRFGKIEKTAIRIIDYFSNRYYHSLDWVLNHRKLTIFSMFSLLILSFFLLPFIGKEFTPKQDQAFIAITMERSAGSDYRQSIPLVEELEQFVKDSIPEVTNIMISYGQTGNTFAAIRGSGSNTMFFRLKLCPLGKRQRSQAEIEELVRRKLSILPDLTYEFQQQGAFNSETGDVSVKLFGDDLDTLQMLTQKIDSIFKTVDGSRDVKNTFAEPANELRIQLNRERIYHYNLSVSQVMNTIYKSFQGEIVARYRERGDDYDVVLRLAPEYRSHKSDLQKLFIKSMQGYIPLTELATIIPDKTPTNIYRESQERIGRVYCAVFGRDLGSVSAEIEAKVNQLTFPEGYRYLIGGVAADMKESQLFLGLALLVAALMVYMVMASQFESLIDPFIILFTIPLSLIGVLWMLFLTHTTLSLIALIGCIMLVGIVVNNGIVLVDAINQLIHKEKMELFAAVKEAGRRRLKPILMTALTTIISLFPLALEMGEGAEAWSPMARSVIGGLVVSTILTLFYVPALYTTLELKGWRKKKSEENF